MINNHKDLSKPYWVAKKEDNSVLNYNKLVKGSIVSTKMIIYTFAVKQDWIYFIEKNGGNYKEEEI